MAEAFGHWAPNPTRPPQACRVPARPCSCEYTCFVSANELVDGHGRKIPMNFSVNAFVVAGELSHNWGVKVLGGQLESHFAAPTTYQSLRIGSSTSSNEGLCNVNLVPFDVLNHRGMVHWNYELEFQTASYRICGWIDVQHRTT